MRSYMINIRKQLVDDLAHRREKLVYALRCPADQEIPKHQLAASIFPPVREPSLYGRGNRGQRPLLQGRRLGAPRVGG